MPKRMLASDVARKIREALEEIQNSGNPLTIAEVEAMAKRRPWKDYPGVFKEEVARLKNEKKARLLLRASLRHCP